MIQGIGININLDPYRGELEREMDRCTAVIRTVLRSIEEGSYKDKARQSKPGTVFHLQMADSPIDQQKFIEDEILKAFNSVIRAFLDYIDKMVAISEATFDKLLVPVDKTITGETQILEYAAQK